ncbi:hypothetical protein NLU13_7767 [Sarocladium strictum]|uniref:Rho-GAP domain-containing protein n=1 Tax=Sarocladium strictum TaxID=5046 RepID=A0AA39L5I3_SARSR|nr:hypothetical protein NLU13_7767 [Sarocladium strictum]
MAQHPSAAARQTQPPEHPRYNESAPRGMAPSQSSTSLMFPHSVTMQNLGAGHGVQSRSSRTWTASSGDLGLLSDTDELGDRAVFVMEYNRLAKKHGVRILVLDDFEGRNGLVRKIPEKRGWLQRLLRSASNDTPAPRKAIAGTYPRHKRSVSDVPIHTTLGRRDATLKVDLQAMVRVSGKSVLYLPAEYAPGAVVLPTCIRATAHHLAHHAMTRGIFRIPGSIKVVNALFDYYCYVEGGGIGLSSTVRCVNLPMHIQCSVHDVASTFKKMLSALPGGILGSLAVFDAMVAIHSQLHGSPEFPRTKQTRIRARLIALAIGTIQSQFRRELICAVFGLLSLIGRIAKVTPREDEEGRSLPTSDLMGYNALGIVFGPLLVGELLDQYTMKITNPGSGLMLFPVSPQKSRRHRHKAKSTDGVPPAQTDVDKVLVANSLAEMLITNWRDIVRQMKALGTHSSKIGPLKGGVRAGSLRPSASETFVIKKPQDWDSKTSSNTGQREHSVGVDPCTPTMFLPRERPRHQRSGTSMHLKARPVTAMSPTLEESISGEAFKTQTPIDSRQGQTKEPSTPTPTRQQYEQELLDLETSGMTDLRVLTGTKPTREVEYIGMKQPILSNKAIPRQNEMYSSPQVSVKSVPPRTSSRPRHTATSSTHQKADQGSLVRGKTRLHHQNSQERQRGRQVSRATGSKSDKNIIAASPPPTMHRKRSAHRSSPQTSRNSNVSIRSGTVLSPKMSKWTTNDKHNGRHSPPISTSSSMSQVEWDLESTSQQEGYLENSLKTNGNQKGSREAYEYLYLAPNGHVERISHEQSPDHVSRASETPRQFYAPMRTPSNLPDQIHAEGASRTEALSKSELRDRPVASTKSLTIRAGSETGSSIPLTFADKLGKFDDSAGSKSQIPKPIQEHVKITRPSVSAAASNPGAVLTMKAFFESDLAPGTDASGSPRESRMISKNSQASLNKTIRSSKSAILDTPSDADDHLLAFEPRQSEPRFTENGFGQSVDINRRPSIPESLASKALARTSDAKQEECSKESRNMPSLRELSLTKGRSHPDESRRPDTRQPGTLGRMIMPQSQPPVAQHLNLARPPSTKPETPNIELSSFEDTETTAPFHRPGSTTMLHAQIRNLQRLLQAKTEEASQFRRQLEAQDDSDIGTLSEQLREAKREAIMWKERAEAAERRVQVFEKFTAKLRGIREASAVAKRQEGEVVHRQSSIGGSSRCSDGSNDENVSPSQHMELRKGKRAVRSTETCGSGGSGQTEEAGVVTARIRRCLHDGPTGSDGANDSLDPQDVTKTKALIDMSLTTSALSGRNLSESAMEVWVAAQELLSAEVDAER